MLSVAEIVPPDDGMEPLISAPKPPCPQVERQLREARARRSEPRRRTAQRLLEEFQNNRSKTAAEPQRQTKSGNRRNPKRSRSKGSMKAEAAARSEVNKLVPRETQRHGDYQFVRFELVEVTEGGKQIKKEGRGVRNLASTQIDRWVMRGRLDERQLAGILFYQEVWRAWIGEPRVVANYSPSVRGGANQAIELWASSRMRAKEGLRLLDQEVFFREPVEHFQVWQNVVIWDEAAGVAGSKIGFCHKPAEAIAQLIVQSLAHKVAEVVIDSSRHDFDDLLLNLNAPRQPGRKRD